MGDLLNSEYFSLPTKAELGHARALDNVQHLGRKVIGGVGFRLELQLGLDLIGQRFLEQAEQLAVGDVLSVPQDLCCRA